jgi:predicted Zn-dependent peptidase
MNGTTTTTLPNNITILTIPLPSVHSVTLIYYFRVGSRYESDIQSGMCHFIEHMLFKGTKSYPTARSLSEAVEGVGGDFNGGTGKEFTDYSIKINSDHLDRAIAVLTDLVRTPRFDTNEMEKERRVIIEELNMYKDTPSEWIQVMLDETVFPGLSLGREVLGTRESVSSITHNQLSDFFHTHYVPDNLVVTLAGHFNEDKAITHLQSHLNDWNRLTTPTWTPITLSDVGPRVTIQKRNTEQVNLCIGFPGLSHTDPDRDALSLLNAILGDGMSSRLFQSIREELGLAYDIGSSVTSFHETGMFEVSIGCDPERTDESIKAVLHELQRLRDEPITTAELQRIKDYTRGRLVIGLEDTYSIASWYGSQQVVRGKIRSVDSMLEQIEAVTIEDLQRVAQRILHFPALRKSISRIC